MKIGFVLDDSLDKADGVQQYVLTLGHFFRQQRHEVHYIVGDTKRTDLPHIHSMSRNIKTHFNQNRMSTPLPASKSKINKLFQQQSFDVLHVQLPYSPFMAGRVMKAAPRTTAVVGTFHVYPASWLVRSATKILRFWVLRSRNKLDAVFSVSAPAAKFARKSLGLRSIVIPNAVNVSFFRSGRELTKLKDGKINIVFLGRLVERKGCAEFLQALEILHTRHELYNTRVIICGKGQQESKLKDFVSKKHLKNVVSFKGFVSETEKAHYLANADIAVFPSLGGESFGIVLIEAMAAGAKVVLAGNNPGYRSVMAGQKDQLVNPTNSKAFAKTLSRYIRSQKIRERAYKWQQDHIHNYDVRTVGEQILAQYNLAIAKHKD